MSGRGGLAADGMESVPFGGWGLSLRDRSTA